MTTRQTRRALRLDHPFVAEPLQGAAEPVLVQRRWAHTLPLAQPVATGAGAPKHESQISSLGPELTHCASVVVADETVPRSRCSLQRSFDGPPATRRASQC